MYQLGKLDSIKKEIRNGKKLNAYAHKLSDENIYDNRISSRVHYYDGILAKKKKDWKKKKKKKKQKTRIKTKNDATGGLRVLYLRG